MLSHYHVLQKLGEGGMGVVYKARDTELGRLVAIKVLSGDSVQNADRRRRFLQEAKAASALNHPNIVTIYEIGHGDGLDFIVMEYVEGPWLRGLIPSEGLPVKEAVPLATQIASAHGAAHGAGIIHRDVKPGNILVTHGGIAKVLDFGLAKLTECAVASDDKTPTRSLESPSQLTRAGMIVGTVAYMSPEQAEGKPIDPRSDVFSFGVVLYEMLTGRRPFQGETDLSTLTSILRDAPAPLPGELPAELRGIVSRALQKNRDQRYASAVEVARELAGFQQALSSGAVSPVRLAARVRQPRVLVPALLAILALAGAGGWFAHRQIRARWAKQEAIPEITRLMAQGKRFEAFDLAVEARVLAPGDPQLAKLWPEVSATPHLITEPPGAEVQIRQYDRTEQPWRHVGVSPMQGVAMPYGYMLVKVSKAGYETTLGGNPTWATRLQYRLHPVGRTPAGMVYVAGTAALGFNVVNLSLTASEQPFFIDRYEVTNREFKQFVDRGGYQKREHWKHPFRKGEQTLTWEDAMKQFVDSTGRPGPATWEAGTYAPGKDDHPVGGVSWYEATAYAEFAGKSLPTLSHWCQAAEFRAAPYIIRSSNFSGSGPARVGQYQGVSPAGAYDMAGNVKEWCWNEGRDGMRFIPGGAWGSPTYQFTQPEALPPFDRAPMNGFRCARYIGEPAATLTRPLLTTIRDYSQEKPVSDEVFRAYRALYAFDRTDLQPQVEAIDDSSPYWRRENVTINAAYGGERLPLYLFLPKNVAPPFQTLVLFPGADAFTRSSKGLLSGFTRVDFVIRSGRAMLFPVFKGTYERRVEPPTTDLQRRTQMVRWVQDLSRAVDYLETRPDLDHARLGFAGVSFGARLSSVLLPLESRLKAAVLYEGGLHTGQSPPEADPVNFAPRVTVPVLMLNGRYDYTFPLETSQKPMFRLLGTPEKDKRHIVYETAHDVNVVRTEVVREVLDFLDKYFGPVQR
jgi:eukaryotic-like serine/threonine-protein kinase